MCFKTDACEYYRCLRREENEHTLMLLLQLIKESICLDHTHIHAMLCGFLLKNSQGE